MSLQDQYAEASAPALQTRVQMAIVKLAEDINTEPTDTENHANRISLATQVVRSPVQFTPAFTTAVCAQGITSQSSDTEISTMCSAVWNVMAGAPPPPTTVGPPAA